MTIPIGADRPPFNWRWWLLEKAGMAIIVALGACAIAVWIPLALLLSLLHSLAQKKTTAPDIRHVPHDPAQRFEPMPWRAGERVFDRHSLSNEPAKMFPHKYSSVAPRDETG